MNYFRLILDSIGCSPAKAAILLHLHPRTVRSYASGDRKTPEEVIVRAAALFIQIEQAALAFRPYPDQLGRTAIPRALHRAIRRRIQEINIVEARGKHGR